MSAIAVEPSGTRPKRRIARRRARRARAFGLAALWGLWEGYRWLGNARGWTWPFAVDDTNMPHVHEILHALRPAAAAGRAAAERTTSGTAALFTGKEALVGFALGARDRLCARRSCSRTRGPAARPAAVHRRLADGADPRDRADGRARPRDERRAAVGRRRGDRRVPDLLPRRDQHAARPALARSAARSS